MTQNSHGRAAGDASKASETVRQTIVETLEAPRLTDIGTEHFVAFKQKREVYERRVTEKNAEQGVDVPTTTYLNSITKPVLDIMITAQWVPVDTVEALTEDHLRACVEERARVDPDTYDLALIERELRTVKMHKGKSLKIEVWKLGLSYSTALRNRGYDQFIAKRPKIAVEQIMRRITHEQLKKRMALTIKLRKDDGFHKDYNQFIRELAKEASAIDRHDAARGFNDCLTDSEPEISGGVVGTPIKSNRKGSSRNHKGNRGNRSGITGGSSNSGKGTDSGKAQGDHGQGKKRTKPKPKCLNPRCPSHHYIWECEMTFEDEKVKLKAKWAQENKRTKTMAGKDGDVTMLGAEAINNNTYLFSASFCDGAVEAAVLADQGSDANIVPPKVLEHMLEANPKLQVHTLPTALRFTTADKNAAPLVCTRKVTSTILLRIRHGTVMAMRDMDWLVSDCDTQYVIIGKRVLKAIGLDNRTLMAAACDQHDGVLNIPELLEKMDRSDCVSTTTDLTGTIYSLLQDRSMPAGSTYHSHGGAEEDHLEDSDVYVDLGEDPVEDLKAALAAKVKEARSNGMSETGCANLASLLKRYQQVFEFGWESPHQPTSPQ